MQMGSVRIIYKLLNGIKLLLASFERLNFAVVDLKRDSVAVVVTSAMADILLAMQYDQ
jgi:hypothetical protein